MTIEHAQVFASFNAKRLKGAEVAKTFVAPDYFATIAQRNHCTLVGPRGSGKTTLLRMLSQSALEAWTHPNADSDYIKYIDYSSVFIPNDFRFREELRSIELSPLTPQEAALFLRATFNTHVFQCFVEALSEKVATPTGKEHRLFRRTTISRETQMSIARSLITLFQLPDSTPSTINGVRLALSHRKLLIRSLFGALLFKSVKERAEALSATDYLHIPLLEALSTMIASLDEPLDAPEEIWCLLLDELELMPASLLNELLDSLRGYSDNRILIKVSLSPAFPNITGLSDALKAIASHDYEEIMLWYPDRVKSHDFTERLWESFANLNQLPVRNAHEVFEHSFTEAVRYKDRRVYRQKGFYANIFEAAMELDPSFKRYIATHNIDINALEELDDNRRAAVVRKIAPLVPLRLFYRTADDAGDPTLRSRKRPLIFSGKEMLFSSCDGNPRWFIGLMNKLIERRNPNGTVDQEVQADVMYTFAQRYLFKLKTEPLLHMTEGNMPSMSLQALIVDIAKYMHRRLVLDAFSANPTSTFQVDGDIKQSVARLIESGVAEGALVYLPKEIYGDPLILDNVLGKTFRITHRFAPLFGLSMRNDRSVTLSTILRAGRTSASDETELDMLKLF
ncbi:MAG: hypothetical protein H6592_08090 [Flavobacteriales bacterium]|nr:hypothetical protein [Flavobacteriales bacterium]